LRPFGVKVSIFIPSHEKFSRHTYSILQEHRRPEDGETWFSPEFTLLCGVNDATGKPELWAETRTDANRISLANPVAVKHLVVSDLTPLLDTWIELEYQLTLTTYDSNETPISNGGLRVFLNGVKLIDYVGQVGYNHAASNFLKLGNYCYNFSNNRTTPTLVDRCHTTYYKNLSRYFT
jgi:hypothetical protein